MSTEPGGVQVGQLSPDGLWRWDGARWVSTTPGFAPTPAPRRSRSWIFWLAGGCALLLAFGAIAAGVGGYSLVKRFQSGAFSCLPSNFPSYPGATVGNENTAVGNEFSPGDNTRCNMVLNSNDGATAVTSFYQTKLNSGDWTIVASDAAAGVIAFQLKSRPQTVGTVTVSGRGQHSQIDITLDS